MIEIVNGKRSELLDYKLEAKTSYWGTPGSYPVGIGVCRS